MSATRTQLRRTRLKNKGKRRRSAREKRLMAEWASYTTRECDVCHASYRVEGHHILEQGVVEAAARALDFDWIEYLWDPRNHMNLCDPCHDGQHGQVLVDGAVKRVSLRLVMRVSPGVWDFACELGLTQRLRHQYA